MTRWPFRNSSALLGQLEVVAALLMLAATGVVAEDQSAASTNRSPAGASEADSKAKALRLENSLGMRFVPIEGLKVRFCIWKTRVQDYEVFRKATNRPWTEPGFAQGPTHPVVNVNWEDAAAFCSWLTAKERREGSLSEAQRYRLPTDQEWSVAVGLAPEQGKTPEGRMKGQIIWPWGHYWPPVAGDGNYGPELKVDEFANTSPVGSFKPNANGLYDMGGNVWEWCDDWFNEARVTKVLRGGSFNDSLPGYLLAAYRFSGTMNLSNEDMGFRVVLESR